VKASQLAGYPEHWLRLAKQRGWSQDMHLTALRHGDENEIAATHPTNFLSEAEVDGRSDEEQLARAEHYEGVE
jgi:hypothetical protein